MARAAQRGCLIPISPLPRPRFDGSARGRALRGAGFDVLTTREAGHQRLSDEEQLAFAAHQGRILYTANVRDFARLNKTWTAEGRTHAGIVLRTRQSMAPGEQVRALTDICMMPLATNRLFFV